MQEVKITYHEGIYLLQLFVPPEMNCQSFSHLPYQFRVHVTPRSLSSSSQAFNLT
jgi:hypothetical protein